jgi:hypothetical protein
MCLLLAVGTSQAAWVSLAPQSFTRLCPQHTGGDREYASHGPRVDAWAHVYTGLNLRDLVILLTMTQKETRSDWSRADLYKTFVPYTAPAGQKIAYIYNAPSSRAWYTDTDHEVDLVYPTDNLVQSFAIKGDTWGNDIGNCTSDDAYLSVYFETIWVWVE